MGEVYRARDAKLNRLVALKVLPASAARDDERRERFAREAQAVAALNHPGIVTIYSVEDVDDTAFITMELIAGRPLSSVIPSNGLPLARVLAIGASVLDAVAAAHQKGILHRDLKPANVMIGEGEHQGRVKVLDFGLAKLVDSGVGAETTALATGEGRILGTVSYMSPEQAEGKAIDARSDVFSLGVMLYEMATGQRPFRGDSNISILSSIIKDSPAPVTETNPALPRDFDRIVRRALAKDPERRYQTAKDFRNDLEELKSSIESGEVSPPPVVAVPAARVWPWVAVAVVVLAAVGIAWSIFRHPAPPLAASSASSIAITPLTSTGTAILPSISPDGKYVVYVEAVADEQSVWVKQIASGGTTRVVPAEKGVDIDGVTVTPDGNFVDFVRHVVLVESGESAGVTPRELWRVPFLGGPARKIVDRVSTSPGWSPDGKQMAYLLAAGAGKCQLIVADANGDHPRAVVALANDAYVLSHSTRPDMRPVWTPDGKSIVVLGGATLTVATSTNVRLTEVDVATGRETVLFNSTGNVGGITDLRGGFALGASGKSFILNLQGSTGPAELWRLTLPGGELTRLTNDLAMYFDASRAGDAIVTSRYERRSSLWLADAAGHGARQIGREVSASPARALAWAGTRLLYSASLAGGAGVWSTDVVSGASALVVPTDSWARISTTADGRTLYYAKAGDGIWTSGADGSHSAKVPNAGGTEPAVTPDGSRLFLYGGAVLDLRTGARTTLEAPFSSHDSLSVSPDGRFVTYSSSNGEQVIVPVSGGEPFARLKLPKLAGTYPHFTPDGLGMAYVDRTGLAIWIQPIASGAPRRLVTFPDRPILQFAWSSGGTQLAVSRAMTISDVVLLSGVR
jgi:serine/threonine protein kinase